MNKFYFTYGRQNNLSFDNQGETVMWVSGQQLSQRGPLQEKKVRFFTRTFHEIIIINTSSHFCIFTCYFLDYFFIRMGL